MTTTNSLQAALDANANVNSNASTTTLSLAQQLNITNSIATVSTVESSEQPPTVIAEQSPEVTTNSEVQAIIESNPNMSQEDIDLLHRIAQMTAYVEPTPTPMDGSVIRQTVPTAEYPHKIRLKLIDDFDLHMEAYDHLLLTFNQSQPWIFPFFPEMAHEVQFIGQIEGISEDHTLRIFISPDAHIHFPPEIEYELDMNEMLYKKIIPEVDFT